MNGSVPGIKDENGNWNTHGHPDRIIHVGERELRLFSRLFDGSDEWKMARLPVLHARQLVEVLSCFGSFDQLHSIENNVFPLQMWNETTAQKDNTIKRNVRFPSSAVGMIYSGPHIGIGNPLFKTSRRKCHLNSDYDSIDLSNIPDGYFQRSNYEPACDISEYRNRIPITNWGARFNQYYRLSWRKMLNQSGERTLIPAVLPPETAQLNTVLGVAFKDNDDLLVMASLMFSLPLDFYVKQTGKSDLYWDGASKLIYLRQLCPNAKLRVLLLNCLTSYYSALWRECFVESFKMMVGLSETLASTQLVSPP